MEENIKYSTFIKGSTELQNADFETFENQIKVEKAKGWLKTKQRSQFKTNK